MTAYPGFAITLKVRDYECDLQGIVNNAVYMHYLEHARHEYLQSLGINFKQLIDKGIYLIAIKAELDYKKMLYPGEHIKITCEMQVESKFKIQFLQSIYNEKHECVLNGTLTGALVDKNKKPLLLNTIFKTTS